MKSCQVCLQTHAHLRIETVPSRPKKGYQEEEWGPERGQMYNGYAAAVVYIIREREKGRTTLRLRDQNDVSIHTVCANVRMCVVCREV